MGNVIINASHVGSIAGRGECCPVPATDEEMKIAKRAAKHTRAKWENERRAGRPHKAKMSEGPSTRYDAFFEHDRSIGNKSEAFGAVLSEPHRDNIPANTRDKSVSIQQLSEAAKRMNVSQSELERRIRALIEYRREGSKS